MRLQIRGEFFNAFNRVNFGFPGTSLGTFGVIQSARDARIVPACYATGGLVLYLDSKEISLSGRVSSDEYWQLLHLQFQRTAALQAQSVRRQRRGAHHPGQDVLLHLVRRPSPGAGSEPAAIVVNTGTSQ